ncbi:tropomyosin [Periplaneta americana]|uniref:tropomyosin n=1 Tax=Periplaneta americana TaxID=6978 RepID=UPI0037E95CBB
MYKRLMDFFGGAMSGNAEDKTQRPTQPENNETKPALDNIGDMGNVAVGEQRALHDRIQNLEQELKVRTEESENYKNRLQLVEKELGILQTMAVPPPINKVSTGVGDGIVDNRSEYTNERESMNNAKFEKLTDENSELREALSKAGELLKDKTDLCDNQEKQNRALTNQISSLKEVVAITKDLLNIRNMEVQHLQSDVQSMEGKIAEERVRHNSMITKMDEATKLNSDLKNEYETQLRIFQDLKSKYEEKVTLLTKENQKLVEEVSMSKTVPEITENDPNPVVNNEDSVSEERANQ